MVSCSPHSLSSPPSRLSDWLEERGSLRAGAPFLTWRDQSLSYGETLKNARRLATWFGTKGVRSGDRIVILARNRPEVAIAVFAAAMQGALFVVLHPGLRPAGFRKIVSQCEPAVVISDRACRQTVGETGGSRLLVDGFGEGWSSWAEVEDCEAKPVPKDPCRGQGAALVFTSGSTGVPRGVKLTHDNIRFAVDAIQERLGYRADDRVGCFLPLSFDYGLYQLFLAARSGALVHLGDPGEVGPRFPRMLRRAEISVLPAVPAMAAALIRLHERRPFDLPRLRMMTNTGERLPREHIARLRERFPGLAVYVMYGLTECKRASILRPAEYDAGKQDTVGRALRGTEVYAADEAGTRLRPGEVGELVVCGPHLASGYWRAPEETARRFRRGKSTGDVALFTGDRGWVDGDGFVGFASRTGELIKHRGHRMSPLEIENEACSLPGVAEAGVLQRESDDTLHLFVTESAEGADEEAILQGLGWTLEPFKVPDFVHRIESLPRTLNGKIDRAALRERLTTVF